MPEAEYVAQYILNGGDRDEFMKKFSKAPPSDIHDGGFTMLAQAWLATSSPCMHQVYQRGIPMQVDIRRHDVTYTQT